MPKSSSSSPSSGSGLAAQQSEPGGGRSDTAAGKLADRPPASLEKGSALPGREFLKKNASALLRREHVEVRDMEEPAQPVKPAVVRKSRKK